MQSTAQKAVTVQPVGKNTIQNYLQRGGNQYSSSGWAQQAAWCRVRGEESQGPTPVERCTEEEILLSKTVLQFLFQSTWQGQGPTPVECCTEEEILLSKTVLQYLFGSTWQICSSLCVLPHSHHHLQGADDHIRTAICPLCKSLRSDRWDGSLRRWCWPSCSGSSGMIGMWCSHNSQSDMGWSGPDLVGAPGIPESETFSVLSAAI